MCLVALVTFVNLFPRHFTAFALGNHMAQFSSLTPHCFGAYGLYDLSSACQPKLKSQECNFLGNWTDLRFLRVQLETVIFKEFCDLIFAVFKVFNVFVDQYKIIHIAQVKLDSEPFFNKMVEWA